MGTGGTSIFSLAIFAAYIVVALLAFWAAIRFARVKPAGRAGDQARARVFTWALVGVALILLGFDKLLHVDQAITEHYRLLSEKGGWYEDRRSEQAIYLIGALMFATPVLIGLMVLCRKAGEAALIAFGMVLCLFLFFVLRMISYHDVDAMMNASIGRLRASTIVELLGLAVIAGASMSRPSASWINQTARVRRSRR